MHVQIKHAVTSAVKTIPVLMEEHALSFATTPNKSSTAYAPVDFLENSVKRKVIHLASSYNSKQRSQKILLFTLYDPASKSYYQTFRDFTFENVFV